MTGSWDMRPARDLGLGPSERLRSMVREPGLGSRATALLWRGAVRGLLAAYRLRIDGRENVPHEPPFVMIANHSSHLDALTLAAAVPVALAGRTYVLAAGDTFFTSDAKAAFAAYAINALPVWRKQTTAQDLSALRQRLHDDASVLILFPEGTRTRDGQMGRFRPGIGALVAGTAVPVVPCFLHGAFEAWPPGSRTPRPGRLRLVVGAPLTFADVTPDRRGTLDVAAQCERSVRALII